MTWWVTFFFFFLRLGGNSVKGERAALEEQVAGQKDKLKKAAARLRSLKEVRKGERGAPRVWSVVFRVPTL